MGMKNAKRAFRWSGVLRKSTLTSIWLKQNVSVCVLIIPELFWTSPKSPVLRNAISENVHVTEMNVMAIFFYLVNTPEWNFFGQWWGKTIDKTKEVKVFSKGVEPLAVWVLVNYMLYSLSYRTLVGVKVPSGHSKSLKNVRLSYEFH